MMKVCLTMIVKDEAAVIARCVSSTKPLIDRWCIVDTGSTDDTEAKIREALADVPGTFERRPWVDFGANRTEAFALAKVSIPEGENLDEWYALVIDADDMFVVPEGFTRPEVLDRHAYALVIELASERYRRPQFFRMSRPWHYEGVRHEYATSTDPIALSHIHNGVIFPGGVRYVCTREGARSQASNAEKYGADARALEEALARNPGDVRSMYYAAQSWRDAGDDARALPLFLLRASAGGFPEEAAIARLEAARILERMGKPIPVVLAAYLEAFFQRKMRAEPLHSAALYLRLKEEYEIAYAIATAAARIGYPEHDVLFIDKRVYDWQAKDEQAVSAYYTNRYEECERISRALVDSGLLPDCQLPRVQANIAWSRHALGLGPAPNAPVEPPAAIEASLYEGPADVIVLGRDRHVHAACFDELADALRALVQATPGYEHSRIVLNAHAFPTEVPTDAIVYNLENVGVQIAPTAFADRALWDFSPRNIRRWRPRADVRLMAVGYHPTMTGRFKRQATSACPIDVVFAGSMNERRRLILDALAERGLRVEIVPHTLYGEGRDRILANAKLCLNVRYFAEGTHPTLRTTHAVANFLPVLSETAPEAPPWALLQVPLEEIVDRCMDLLEPRRHALLDDLARTAFDVLTRYPMHLPHLPHLPHLDIQTP